MKRKKLFFIFAVLMLIASLVFVFTSCDTFGGGSPPVPGALVRLYITDTFNGKIYTYDIDSGTVSSTPLLSTGQNATGKIYFYNGIGYIAVGAWMNDPGVYYFDPNAAVPTAIRIGKTISAQYIAFYSATKAYVTDANWGGSTGVYTFDPSDPSAGLTGPLTGTDETGKPNRYLQDIRVGYDGYIYVADNTDDIPYASQVLKIDPENYDTVTYIDVTTATGGVSSTGLLEQPAAGPSAPYVYVINVGSWGLNGTIDSIDTSDDSISNFPVTGALINPTKMVWAESMSYYATGYSNTYQLTLSATPEFTATEITGGGGASFGGGDILVYDSKVYVPGYTGSSANAESTLMIIDADTAAVISEVSVGSIGDGITAVAVYEP